MRLIYVSGFILMCACIIAGCSENERLAHSWGGETSASMVIQWPQRDTRLIPLACESIKVEVTGPYSFAGSETVNRPSGGTHTTVSFPTIPVGSLTFTATAYPLANAQGVAQATATQVLTGVANVPLNVTITMQSTIASVTVSPTQPSLEIGQSVQLSATSKNAGGQVVLAPATNAYSWSSSNTSIATVSSTGLVSGVGEGAVTITATEQESGVTGAWQCSVVPPVTVSISPETATVTLGQSAQFTATVSGTANTAVTWSVVEAGGGSVTSTGLYTAGQTPGTFHVRATSVAAPAVSATATVTVQSTGGTVIVN